MNILCTICSDIINQSESIYVTKCGHIFHQHCLSQWIDRSKTCPQCRNKVTQAGMYRIYPTISSDGTLEAAPAIQAKLDDANLQLRQSASEARKLRDKIKEFEETVQKTREQLKYIENKLVAKDSALTAMKEQRDYFKIENKDTQRLKEENESLHNSIKLLSGMQRVLNASVEEIETMLGGYSDVRTLATFATALKKALWDSEKKKTEERNKLQLVQSQLALEKSRREVAEQKLSEQIEKCESLKEILQDTDRKRSAESNWFTCSGDKRLCVDEGSKRDEEMDTSGEVIERDKNEGFRVEVRHKETNNSPYLQLRHAGLSVNAGLKPSEFALLNKGKSILSKQNQENSLNKLNNQSKQANQNKYSIFHNKVKDLLPEPKEVGLDMSFDGLGGHSKLDKFPQPRVMKNLVPKLTTKHKLKRPESNHDISRMFKFNNS